MNPYDTLIRPIISEKSNKIRDNKGKYTFLVRVNASKKDIKKAVKTLFEVDAEKIQTLISHGKRRRRGMHYSQPKRSKKAIVTLAKDQTIKIFEDQ